MRILFHHRVGSRDGQSVHIEELIAALQRQGHETLLIGPSGYLSTRFGGSNPLVDRIKRWLPAAIYEVLEIVYNLGAVIKLYVTVRTYRPDFIYERFSLFLFAGVWTRCLSGVPILLEVNAPLYEERAKNDGLRLRRLGCWAQRLIWSNVDHIFPVTAVLGRIVADYGVPQSRITVIPNGVNQLRFSQIPATIAAKTALGLAPRLTLGFTGFIRGWNAVHELIDFVALHHSSLDLHVLVVGDGPARPSLQEHARIRGVADRLTITGTVERDDVGRYVAAFDVAVLPGVTPYSSPLKLFEYLQLGRAIVAPDGDNIREILTDGENALLFDPAQSGALQEALLSLCRDEALRVRLGKAAHMTVLGKSLTWDYNATRVTSIAEWISERQRSS